MKYSDGRDVLVGDKVLADKSGGVVVAVIDTEQFSNDYPAGWVYLGKGMLVETKDVGLIHYPETGEGVILVDRATGVDA